VLGAVAQGAGHPAAARGDVGDLHPGDGPGELHFMPAYAQRGCPQPIPPDGRAGRRLDLEAPDHVDLDCDIGARARQLTEDIRGPPLGCRKLRRQTRDCG
jgi:hypothetical protein